MSGQSFQSRYPMISRTNPEKDYELLQMVGSGTYGDVYTAKIVSSGKTCALKIIKIEPGEDFNIIQLEIAILAECKHPNIVGYYGSYLRRDKLWIAMEYCGGGSVQDIYRVQGGLNEPQIAFICRETLVGLQYLHSQSKIHRDIKGGNILLADDGAVKLADFGIAAKINNTLMRRATFIGTPYWMAPEVADVEKQGGYNQKCDIWAVGITAIELAEKKPPNFDLHPMKALVKMTKKKYAAPTLAQKEKWSQRFHDFLKSSLQKDPKKRPSAAELLKNIFVADRNLGPHITKPLAQALAIAAAKTTPPTPDDDFDEEDEITYKRDDTLTKIQSLSKPSKEQVHNDISGQNFPLNPKVNKVNDQDPLPSWMQAEAGRGNIRKVTRNGDSESTEQSEEPVGYIKVGAKQQDPPPLPPRNSQKQNGEEHPSKTPKAPERSTEPRAYFSKIFNGCPLHLTCAQTWTHPHTGIEYVYLGAEEGLYSLQMTQNADSVMEQVMKRTVYWLCIFNNVLISIAGSHRSLYQTNLVLLNSEERTSNHSLRNPTHKIQDSKGCVKCDIARNPYNDQKFLVTSVPKGILLLRWYPPRHIFMMDKLIDIQVSPPHPEGDEVFQCFVDEERPYPLLCVGVYQRPGCSEFHFDLIDLNLEEQPARPDQPDYGNKIVPCTLNQLESNAVMIGYDRYAKLVDFAGRPTSIKHQVGEVVFDNPSNGLVRLDNCILSFHDHGLQGKSLITSKVTSNVMDEMKKFRLLGSLAGIIIETRPCSDPTTPSNLYILVSGEN